MPQVRTLVGEPTLKELLFRAVSAAFPGGSLTVTDYAPGHSKLAARRLVHAHIGVRVVFQPSSEFASAYAIAGMLPATAGEKDVDELIARLADDKRRAEAAATPVRPV